MHSVDPGEAPAPRARWRRRAEPLRKFDWMRPLRPSAVGLGVAYIVAIGFLAPLLGSTADSSTAFVDHFSTDANVRTDLIACLLLLVVATLIVWVIVLVREAAAPYPEMARRRDLVGAGAVVSATGILVATGLLATVPVTIWIGNITDDPGIDPPVQAGIAQAGTIVLVVSMLAVGATFVLAARIGRAIGAISRWVVATAWVVAVALLLGISIALLFPFGFWAIAFGLAWKDVRPQVSRSAA